MLKQAVQPPPDPAAPCAADVRRPPARTAARGPPSSGDTTALQLEVGAPQLAPCDERRVHYAVMIARPQGPVMLKPRLKAARPYKPFPRQAVPTA